MQEKKKNIYRYEILNLKSNKQIIRPCILFRQNELPFRNERQTLRY